MPIKALLVEDSPADARMIQELLRQNGGRQVVVRRADRVATALESVDADKPDVLILDLRLPDSKGLVTFRRMHARLGAVPIIVLTGMDDVDLALETIAEGAADYLLKSDLSGGLLMRVVRYSIERKRIEESLRRTEQELKFKNQIAGAFLSAPNEEMAPRVLRAMLDFTQSAEGTFGYVDRDGALVCPTTARAGEPEAEVKKNGRFPRGTWSGIWGRALAEKRPLLLNEPTRELGALVTRVLAVPLLDRGELVGLFEVANKAVDYDAADREFLERAAAYLAPILHVRLQRDAHEKALSTALTAAEILLQEVHHRVKNNLQIISSLLNMQAEGLPEGAQKALDESQRRVRSMALVHEQLYNRERPDQLDFGEYVASLAGELFSAYSVHSGAIRLRLDLEPVLLDIDQAMPCGLILNELMTNSLKYAFPETHSGEILVALHATAEGRVTLRIADNGIGLAPGFDWRQSQSLGLRIVEILTAQLNGTLDYSGGTGADFTLAFTCEQCKERPGAPGL